MDIDGDIDPYHLDIISTSSFYTLFFYLTDFGQRRFTWKAVATVTVRGICAKFPRHLVFTFVLFSQRKSFYVQYVQKYQQNKQALALVDCVAASNNLANQSLAVEQRE